MGTPEELASYYQGLLIKQYYDQPNAQETIYGIALGMCCDWVFPQIKNGFNVNDAVGVQLDVLGKYIGASRSPVGGAALGDSDYRFLLKMKIIKNRINNTTYSIQKFMFDAFNTAIKVIDNFDMTITYQISVDQVAIMTAALNAGLLPRPIGVGIILAATLNPNGDFGYSFEGTADADVNGYGVVGYATYEGGSYLRSIVYG